MAARLAQGGTSWDDMLDAAVLQGLAAAPDRVPADDGEDAAGAAGAHDAEDELHEDDLDEMHDSLTREVSASLQAATGRAVMLLRRDPTSAELQANPNPGPSPSPSPSPSASPSPSPKPNRRAPSCRRRSSAGCSRAGGCGAWRTPNSTPTPNP